MPEFPAGLISDAELKSAFTQRAKSVDEKRVTASSKEALATLVKGYEQDGWRFHKKNKKSVVMVQDKPSDRQLEDDVWCLLNRLGFTEMNLDRNLMIKGRQIDIFAKDDETVFIVECTQTLEKGDKSLKALIDKINAIRGDVVQAVHGHYGKEPKLKVKWAIATRNVDWRKADLDRANEAKIAVITESDIDYYERLLGYLKGAARYQFLARYLRGEGVDGLRLEVPATRGYMGDVPFYNFLISPYDLLKMAYISHKANTSADDFDTYQRMVQPSRLKKIADYIDNEGGQFPTNIVVNFKTPLEFHRGENESDDGGTYGKLKLPGLYGSAWVIDGQHRLFGFAFAKRGENHLLPVLAYENLPATQEMKLFVDINSKQVKVKRILLDDLYSNLNHDSDDPAKRIAAQYPRIVTRLDKMPTSPFRNRIRFSDQETDRSRCLTLNSFVDGIKENRFLGGVVSSGKNPPMLQAGVLSHPSGKIELSGERAADIISGFFNVFATVAKANWDLGDAKGGFLSTPTGVRALLRLLGKLIGFVQNRDGVEAIDLDVEDIVERISPYATALAEHFNVADPAEIHQFRARHAGGGIIPNCLGMMGIIAEAKPEFSTPEVRDYLNSRDKEGSKLAGQLLFEINEILFEDVIASLKIHYGTDKEAWWWQGIPQQVRAACDDMVNKENGAKERWRYLSLANYQTIVSQQGNWPLFSTRYDFTGKGKAVDRVSWIGHLCKLRNTTFHPEKGIITREDVAYVKEMYAKVKEKIQGVPVPAVA